MELFDLYDKNRQPLGRTMQRGTAAPENCYHIVVHICIFNSRGEMLIQQRQPFKSGWSGLWDFSCGGSVVSGEDSRSAAEREISEELGLSIPMSDSRPVMTINYGTGFDDIYVVNMDVSVDELSLQPEEVRDAKWATSAEIFSMIDSGEFIPYSKSLISLLFEMRERRGAYTRDDPSKRRRTE